MECKRKNCTDSAAGFFKWLPVKGKDYLNGGTVENGHLCEKHRDEVAEKGGEILVAKVQDDDGRWHRI